MVFVLAQFILYMSLWQAMCEGGGRWSIFFGGQPMLANGEVESYLLLLKSIYHAYSM